MKNYPYEGIIDMKVGFIGSNKLAIIEIKVITKSSQNCVVGFEGKILKIKCRAVPEKGKANEIVISLLADYFNVPKNGVSIIRGKTSSKKTIEIEGLQNESL